MDDLEPNSPKKRIQYVIDTYRGSKNRAIIPEVIEASLMLIGMDYQSYRIRQRYEALWHYLWGEPGPLYKDMRSWSPPIKKEDAEAYVEVLFDGMPQEIERFTDGEMPEHHPHDFMIPWMAKELGRLLKAVRRGNATGSDYEEATRLLKQKGPAIGMMVEKEKVDLSKTSLAEALELLLAFDPVAGAYVPPGDTVYTFDDGYTIQRLRGEEQLKAEGEVMQHCVGNYCAEVDEDKVAIFSLRDKTGKPHVTMEWRPSHPMPAELGFFQMSRLAGSFEQIRGKQNDMPASKYRKHVQEFINERFSGDPLGLLMVVMPEQKISFKGVTLNDVDFTTEYSWEGVPMEQADFSGSILNGVIFGDLDSVYFTNAHLDGVSFYYAATLCVFDKAHFVTCRFDNVTLKECDFVDAKLDDAVFSGTTLVKCNFRNAEFEGSAFHHSVLDGGSMEDVRFAGGRIEGTTIDDVEMNGLTLKDFRGDEPGFDNLDLRDLDLSEVSIKTARVLFRGVSSLQSWDGITWPEGFDPDEETGWRWSTVGN